jgi:hypothetical protein
MLEIKGLTELNRKVGDIAERARKLDGTRSVPVTELLTPNFVSQHTRFNTAEELFAASGFEAETADDFKSIPDADRDAHIRSASDFPDWETMLGTAVKEWTKHQLGL